MTREKSAVVLVQLAPVATKFGTKNQYQVKSLSNRIEPRIGTVIGESEAKSLISPYCKVSIVP
jgi:hypothetical protein